MASYISHNADMNLRNFLSVVNNNHINMIINNISNLMTLLYENGVFVLIKDRKGVINQYSYEWDVTYLYKFLNMIYNRDIRRIVFNECINCCPDIIHYININRTDLHKIHYHNFNTFFVTLDENNKKIYSEYLSYFEL